MLGPEDLKEFLVKAKQGDGLGQRMLADAYMNNSSIESKTHAYAWLTLSLMNGMDIKEILDTLIQDMTPEEIEKAKEKLADMIEDNPELISS